MAATITPNQPAMATWMVETASQARQYFDGERGFQFFDDTLSEVNLFRIAELGWPMWVRMANDQLVCIRAKRAA